MNQWQPVPVQIEKVVIGAVLRPGFIVNPVIRVTDRIEAAVRIRPGGKAIESVRVEAGVQQNDRVLQKMQAILGRESL